MTQVISHDETATTAAVRPQLVSIQYLRAIAALTVLVTHALQWPLGGGHDVLVNTGRLGVEIFFVLSGFIITVIGGPGSFAPFDFARNRILRIVPMYWLATFVVIGLALAMPSSFRNTVPTLEGVFKSLAFIPSEMPKAPLLLLGWTLNFEMFFYLVFGSLFFLKAGTRTAVIAVFFLALMAAGSLLQHPSHVQAFYTSYSLLGFVVGAGIGRLYQLGWLQRLGGRAMAGLTSAGALALTAFYLITLGSESGRYLPLFHLSMSFAAMSIVVAAIRAEAEGRLPQIPLLRFLGDASYSLYLFHLFAVAGVWAIAPKLLGPVSLLTYLPLTLLAVASGLASGVLAYWYLERPVLEWTRRRRHVAAPNVLRTERTL